MLKRLIVIYSVLAICMVPAKGQEVGAAGGEPAARGLVETRRDVRDQGRRRLGPGQ